MEVQEPPPLTTEMSQQWNHLGTKMKHPKSLIFQKLKTMLSILSAPLWTVNLEITMPRDLMPP